MKTARIYVFGDSLVYGAWDSQGGWCDRLKCKLHQLKLSGNDAKFQMFNLGIGGETSKSLLQRIKAEIDSRHRLDWPAIIIIATGANDTRYTKENSKPSVSIDEYQANLKKIANIAKQYTDKILFVGLATVENEVQQFKNTLLSNALLRKYDKIIADIAKENNLPKIDVISSFTSSEKKLYSTDGVHPNDLGHEIIENLVWDELEKILLES